MTTKCVAMIKGRRGMTRRLVVRTTVALATVGVLAGCAGPVARRTASSTPQVKGAALRWATDYEAAFHPVVDAAKPSMAADWLARPTPGGSAVCGAGATRRV